VLKYLDEEERYHYSEAHSEDLIPQVDPKITYTEVQKPQLASNIIRRYCPCWWICVTVLPLNVQSAGIFRSGISESTDHQQSSVYKATHLIQNYVGFILTATSQVGVEETTGRAAVGSDCPGLFVALEKAPGRISYDIEAEMFFRHAQESERR